MVMPLGNEAKSGVTSWATYLLIAINLICFGIEQLKPASFLIAYSATPYEITHNVDLANPFMFRAKPGGLGVFGQPSSDPGVFVHQANGPSPIWLTLVSAMFLHANLIHLAGNMLFLTIFGQRVEEVFGRSIFLGFYLGSGLVGTLAQILAEPNSLTPILGASGAIAGVMGAYLVWFPRDRVRVLVFNSLFLVPASGVIGCWIVTQLLLGLCFTGAVAQSSQIAYLAHIGGVVVGIGVGLALKFGRLNDRHDAIDRVR